ncbi:MAG: extracellular solute-binding protein [Armatimonadetes bacterium]|nr:extracellular solute-binding protein [Armatimonadota bacterium]
MNFLFFLRFNTPSRSPRWRGALLLLACMMGLSGAVVAPAHAQKRVKLVVWGLQSSEETKGQDAQVAEFERRNPHIDVSLLSMGAGGMDPQKLMTSIAGGVPPDLINQDRFTIGDWASRDTFMALDDLIRTNPGPIQAKDYYPAAWNEALYRGKVYAIPSGIDDRALYYNRKLFREAGLDPDRPPLTWEELEQYAVRLTKKNPDGSYKSIGFIPNYGNSWLYLYSWQNGGEFMDPTGRKATLANPYTKEALDYMVRVYDKLGGVERVNAYQAGFQGNALDPFFIDKVAMKIDGNWVLNNIARYAPDLDFAVAPAPVPAERLAGKERFAGQPPYITWSGGFSFAIPRGARNVNEAWAFIQWMNSVESNRIRNRVQREYNLSKGRPYVPNLSANIPVNEAIFREFAPENPRLRNSLKVFLDLLPVAKYRPVTFVGQRLWDEHVRAFEQATRHKKTSALALLDGQRVVQKELNKVYSRADNPLLPWTIPVGVIGLGFLTILGGVAYQFKREGPMGRMARREALAGYLFASPWIFGFLVFTLGPILMSAVLSFCDYDVLHAPRFVGLQNYRLLTSPTEDWPIVSRSLANVAFLAIFSIPLTMAVGLGIALLLNANVKGMNWYRTVYYLPSIVPVVAGAVLWVWVLNPEYGLINAAWRSTLTSWFGLEAPKWLASETWSKPALILLGLWGAGGGMILWLAGLQGVPKALYEAAQLDGANAWQQFRNVTLPMISPYIFFNFIIGTIGVIQMFEPVYIMTGEPYGGPADSTMVPVPLLFRNGFQYFKMGYASALAWILFAVILLLSMLQLKASKRWVYYDSDRK